jgi:hypothetical protein
MQEREAQLMEWLVAKQITQNGRLISVDPTLAVLRSRPLIAIKNCVLSLLATTPSVSFYLSLDSANLYYPATNKKKRREYTISIHHTQQLLSFCGRTERECTFVKCVYFK